MELNDVLIEWLIGKAPERKPDFERVATMGRGPLDEAEFDDLLRRYNIDVYQAGPLSEVLVLGRDQWDEAKIREILNARAGQSLRAYSQELFLVYLISGVDPLDEPEQLLRELAAGHPALTFLEKVGFPWPTTEVPVSGGGGFSGDLLELGYLRWLGYSVGKSGRPVSERQAILLNAYDGQVPPTFPQFYVADWGPPSSSRRLQKIAESIAAFCRLAQLKANPPHRAIADWERDLGWLKHTLYDGRYQFQWPDTAVW